MGKSPRQLQQEEAWLKEEAEMAAQTTARARDVVIFGRGLGDMVRESPPRPLYHTTRLPRLSPFGCELWARRRKRARLLQMFCPRASCAEETSSRSITLAVRPSLLTRSGPTSLAEMCVRGSVLKASRSGERPAVEELTAAGPSLCLPSGQIHRRLIVTTRVRRGTYGEMGATVT